MPKKIICAIMAGGQGLRLWPMSHKELPKQFLDLTDRGFSLFQSAVLLAVKASRESPIIIGNFDHRFIISEQLAKVGVKNCRVILEISPKNTLPTAIVASLAGLASGFEQIMLLTCDHIIGNEDIFLEYIQEASALLEHQDKIIAFGIKPTLAHTGYGYIETGTQIGNVAHILSFKEKPDAVKANEYLCAKHFLWNSGMLVYNASKMLFEAKELEHNIYENVLLAYQKITKSDGYEILDAECFDKITPISIDYGVMEKTKDGLVICCQDFSWSDVGDFGSLYRLSKKDAGGNAILGQNIITNNSTNSLLINESSNTIVVNEADNMVIVANKDIVMVRSLKRDS